MMDLRLGDWRDVLADVECDALVVDPPYGARTHAGHDAGVERVDGDDPASRVVDHLRRRRAGKTGGFGPAVRRRTLGYGAWMPGDVREFVHYWSRRTRGWFCAFSCSDLFQHWRAALDETGRYTFAPVACVVRAMSVRLSGDGPSSWTVYLNVARPRKEPWSKWGSLNGAYIVDRAPAHIGGKPVELMAAIIRDYTRHGDLVCDPCAGLATTGIAAVAAGRRFVGAEVDEKTHTAALERARRGVQAEMFA